MKKLLSILMLAGISASIVFAAHGGFKDSTGTITVEIDDDKWGDVKAGTEDKLELVGEVEKKYNSTELDVDSVRKL